MGLDIYLFKCKEVNISKSIITSDELEELEIYSYTKKEYDKLPKSMRDACKIQKVKSDFYNMPKILKDYGFDENADAHITGLGGGHTHISVYLDDETKEIDIDDNTLKEKYLFTQINRKYVCQLEELDYQRKGLNDFGWSLLPENCEYSDDKDKVLQMTKNGGLSKSFINNWIDNETVFWAWW